MSIFFYILVTIFVIINIIIIYNDILFKKIHNKYLLILLSLSIVHNILFIDAFSIFFFTNIFVSTLISFLLFYFGAWSAGDAKYIIVLTSFLQSEGIFILIGNIGLVTIIYLLLFALYSYTLRPVVDRGYIGGLIRDVKLDIHSKIDLLFTKKSAKKSILGGLKVILPIVLGFLIFFTIIRLIRIYLIQAYLNSQNTGQQNTSGRGEYILGLIEEYNIYIIVICLLGIFLIYRYSKKYLKSFFFYVCRLFNFSENTAKIILMSIAILFLAVFIIYEYIQDSELIVESLVRIFTFYICIYIIIKLLLYAYFITFQLGEVIFKPIKKLKPGDIVDKSFLIQIFGTQKILGFEQEVGKYAPNPQKHIENFENPVEKETVFKIKDMYRIVNLHHKKQKTAGFEKIEAIKVLKTFAFAPYIFLGFIISYIYGNSIMYGILEFSLEQIFNTQL